MVSKHPTYQCYGVAIPQAALDNVRVCAAINLLEKEYDKAWTGARSLNHAEVRRLKSNLLDELFHWEERRKRFNEASRAERRSRLNTLDPQD